MLATQLGSIISIWWNFEIISKQLCDEIVYHIANDVLESRGKSHDLYLCTEIEKKEIRKALSTYMNDLPEYHHLIDALFVEK